MAPKETSLWRMIAAPIVWALHFLAVYVWTALACARTGEADGARLAVAALTAVALALILVVGRRAWRQWDFEDGWDHVHEEGTDEHRREFLGHAGWLLALVSAIGVLFVALPAIFIGSCR